MPLSAKSLDPADPIAPAAWRPMRNAPRDRPILLKAGSLWHPTAIVGVYMAVHGAWHAQPFFGQAADQIQSSAWCDLPAAQSPEWLPMSTAPHGRAVLLRAHWAGKSVAIVGRFAREHQLFCTRGDQQVFANAWAEIPEDRADV